MARRTKGLLSIAAIAALMLPVAAFAQDTPEDDGASGGIQDIIVTANKREQSLNATGVTATVLGGDALEQQQISSLADLSQYVPSLSYAAAPNGTPVYTLRGVGFYESSIGAYPSVSIYVDEAPLPFPVMTAHSTYDLERVEVLKGPQGTLFGLNATGGAINYIAKKPTDSFEAGATLSYGRFNEINGEAYISGPITEGVQARLAGRIERADGWQISNSNPSERNGKVRNYMGRFQLAVQPSDSFRLLFSVNGWKDKSETLAGQYIAQQFQNENLGVPYGFPVGAFRAPAVLATPFSPLKPRAADWSRNSIYGLGKVPFADNSMVQGALRADLDVGDFGTLTSLTNYVSIDIRQGNDYDGMPVAPPLDVPLTDGKIKTFSQELRFANDPANPFRFVIGGNYERDHVNQLTDIDYSGSSATIGFGTLFGLPIGSQRIVSDQRVKTYALFGNFEYEAFDGLTLKAGVRYTNARNRARVCQSDVVPPYELGQLLSIFSGLFRGQPPQPYTPGQCLVLNVDVETGQPVVDYAPLYALAEYRNTLKEDNVSWRLGADYEVAPRVLLYTNVSKGYKAGSFPHASGTTLGQNVPVRQESVMAYEGGIKASLIDRTLQLNLAGFYYDYKDKQLRTKLVDPTFGQLDVLRNIPKSSIKGFELELTAHPGPGFTVNAAYTFLDAKVDKFIGVNAGGDTNVNFAGTRIPFTPKHQIAVGANYDFALSNSLSAFVGASVNFRSDTIATLGGDVNPTGIHRTAVPKVYSIDDYTLVDGQLGIKDPDDKWRAYVWGKNIFNKYYWSNVVSGYDTVTRFPGMPATYGVTFSVNFR